MDDYKIIVEQEHSTVMAHYEVEQKPDGGYQSEAKLEHALIEQLQGQGYGVLKSRVTDCVIAALEPLQTEFKRLMADKKYLQQVIDAGAENANRIALRTLRKVQKKIGFAPRGNA